MYGITITDFIFEYFYIILFSFHWSNFSLTKYYI